MTENLILDDGCIVENEDMLDGDSGYFGEQYTSESIRYRGIDSNKGEASIVFVALMKLNRE